MTNKIIGKYGEDIAKNFLINKGFEILETNYRFSRIAEIDIIASKKDILHFVEVKTRTSTAFGAPIEAINQTKLRQIYTCAMKYMTTSKKRFKAYQIDAIGIELKSQEVKKIDFIENISL